MSSVSEVTAKSLWDFVQVQALAKSTVTLAHTAKEIRKLVQAEDVVGQAQLLAKKIEHLPFPYETFDEVHVQAMNRNLAAHNETHAKLVLGAQMIPQEPGDANRSHMIINGERWGANHSYDPKYWKAFTVRDCTAVIENPSGPNHPGRLVDYYTQERYNSSIARTSYTSPVKGWEKQLPRICKKLLQSIKDEADQSHQLGLPYQYKSITEADFREAAVNVFPCSYHFPPTALHATLYFLNELTPEVFNDGCRMLDTSAGHGHRLIGAITCPMITYMAATDPNQKMQEGYRKMMKEMRAGDPFDAVHVGADGHNVKGVGTKTREREFKVWNGVAEDPNNPIYKVDKLYNLVFSSPPFFNTEAYGEDKGQATHAYTTFEKWVSGFLDPVLQNSWKVLEPGGYLALNLTDAHTNQCVDALMKIVTETLEGDYLGMIPSRKAIGASRWIHKEDRKISIQHGIDPIWVFRKK